MTEFEIHTAQSAPDRSKTLLEQTKAAFGVVPNLHAVMAEAPGLLEGYLVLHRLFLESSFTDEEKTVVWQSINVEHDCHYCVPSHTGIAKRMGVDVSVSDALRNETPLPTPRLEALRRFTLQMVRERGSAGDRQVEAFLAAGFTSRQVLEVVLAISQKVMSNYTNKLANTPIEPYFEQFAWQRTPSAELVS